MSTIKFVHTNIIAQDWKKLADFYVDVFQCERLEPHRDLSEPWLAEATNIPSARLKGAHLRLPGFAKDEGPTLEIFQYQPQGNSGLVQANDRGFGHIAFLVDNVQEVAKHVLEQGGSQVGEQIQTEIRARLEFRTNFGSRQCFLRDLACTEM
ncbi:MAG: VOC family protein [Myxococcota bacterium]